MNFWNMRFYKNVRDALETIDILCDDNNNNNIDDDNRKENTDCAPRKLQRWDARLDIHTE